MNFLVACGAKGSLHNVFSESRLSFYTLPEDPVTPMPLCPPPKKGPPTIHIDLLAEMPWLWNVVVGSG